MKIAITGKGGVGKTTICALLCREFARRGYRVLAVDADPDANLAEALGFPDAGEIRPIVELKELIKERTGEGGGLVRLNPRVDDIPRTHSASHDGVKLIVMGGIKRAGGGCACPENVFLKELVGHILLSSEEIVVMDMEAGIEHLGRATAESVDCCLIAAEPSALSIGSAKKIARLARELGIARTAAVANKTTSRKEEAAMGKDLGPLNLIGAVPFSPALRQAALATAAGAGEPELGAAIAEIAERLLEAGGNGPRPVAAPR